jgi:hypothetical protein
VETAAAATRNARAAYAAALVDAESLRVVLAGSRRRREDSGANGSSADMSARNADEACRERNVVARTFVRRARPRV